MNDIAETVQETIAEGREQRLNSLVAILVAITATVMALGNIKDGNIVQAMQAAQSKAVDTWSQFQAESMKQHIAETARDDFLFRLESNEVSGPAKAKLEERISHYEAEITKYANAKAQLSAAAKESEAEYDRLNFHDDQFDMADAFLTIGITLYGITALTRKRWLLVFGIGLTCAGTVMTLAGFLGWSIHPDMLATWLS